MPNRTGHISIEDREYSPCGTYMHSFHPIWTPRELAPPEPARVPLADQVTYCPPHLVRIERDGTQICQKCGDVVRRGRFALSGQSEGDHERSKRGGVNVHKRRRAVDSTVELA